MRVVVIGGTKFVGPAAVRQLVAAGHQVGVAHSGAHEHPAVASVDHLHGDRGTLLGLGGTIGDWQPEVLVDTFPGGATAAKAEQLADCAARTEARAIAISSMDVYQHGVDSGVADGGGMLAMAVDPIPLGEEARRRVGPYPGGTAAHDNVAMEDALAAAGCTAILLRPGAIYGPHPSTREWTLVRRIAGGDRRLPLPDGGVQVFHRVAVDRLARAILAAAERTPGDSWPATSSIRSTGTTRDWPVGSARSSTGSGSRRRSPSRRPTTRGRRDTPSSDPIVGCATPSVSGRSARPRQRPAGDGRMAVGAPRGHPQERGDDAPQVTLSMTRRPCESQGPD
ncbi:MAG TPA: hypothetical protein VH299_05395 [Solirubrobacterales bacterium]|jgi:nucleoside-diphosphate-sugar epimerase|nr:hypothetical protein [Solirubrobacterales bacterium]